MLKTIGTDSAVIEIPDYQVSVIPYDFLRIGGGESCHKGS